MEETRSNIMVSKASQCSRKKSN